MKPAAHTVQAMSGGTVDPGRVYLVTSADQPALGYDDRLLHHALLAAGAPVTVAVWTDPDVDWESAAVCLIRSVWDYHLQPERFARWLDRISGATTVLNPPRLVAWNMHKRYLRQLTAAGIPTIDTVWITPGTNADIHQVLRDTGWDRALLKPAVSASAWRTAKIEHGDTNGQRLLGEILRHCEAMLQPYLPSVERHGEVSVIVIDGRISHAARRQSALTGDIEQTRHGSPHQIAADERLLAERVMSLVPERKIIGHLFDVDIVYGFRWRLVLTEDKPAYPGYNEKLWSGLPRPNPAGLLAAWAGIRAANIALLRGVPPADWKRRGTHGEQGDEAFDLMVDKIAGHDLAHLNQLARTVAIARER